MVVTVVLTLWHGIGFEALIIPTLDFFEFENNTSPRELRMK
jgi:hypothetical protein